MKKLSKTYQLGTNFFPKETKMTMLPNQRRRKNSSKRKDDIQIHSESDSSKKLLICVQSIVLINDL